MKRRTFVKGAFGLVVLAAAGGLGTRLGQGGYTPQEAPSGAPTFTTAEDIAVESSVGPLMQGGIDLVEREGEEGFAGLLGPNELFYVDDTGAQLMMLADGSRTIDQIADEAGSALSQAVDPADAASFFVELGQAGYLKNEVYVNLLEFTE